MAAHAEARAGLTRGDRLADEEFSAGATVLVVKIDDPVVLRLKAIVSPGLAARRQRGVEQHIVARLLSLVVEDVEGVSRLHAALQIDVVGENLDEFGDDRTRGLLLERCLVK